MSGDGNRATMFVVTARGGGGLSYKATRSDHFARPTRALRVAADAELTLAERCRAMALVLPEDLHYARVTAAHLWGFPLPARLTEQQALEVATPEGRSRANRPGVRSMQWRLREADCARKDDVALTAPARTWFDLAAVLGRADLTAVGDFILRARLAPHDDLREVVSWARRRRGVAAARDVVALLDAGAESPPESRVRYLLISHGIPRPECNANISVNGQWLARGDMVWREEKVVAEYDGAVHLPERRRQYDAARRNLLQSYGWTVIVFTARDLRTPHLMAHHVQLALETARRRR